MKQILIALMLLTAAVVQIAGAAELKPYTGTIQTPALALKDLRGKVHNLSDYKNQVVLVQFWATYCAPCRKEMPSMNRLQDKLKGKPFKILAVNMAEEASDVKAFVKEVKPGFTILLDTDGTYIQQWKVFAAPANFIIGKDGKIKYTLYGGVEWDADEIVATLTQLLN
ncbi:MAG: TlpA disulfide reductase family protein [Granulosicoccaceae bacterium]|jgi:thiol-disulfide isomerase/thioredoxin